MDERDGSCASCGSTCRAIGQQLKPGQIPVFDLDTARKVAQWCPACKKVFCGRCCGAQIGGPSLKCPLCQRQTDFASLDHWRL